MNTMSHSSFYQMTSEDELLFYSTDSRVDNFWAEMAKKKTFAGGMFILHLAHLMTTQSVITHSNVPQDWH